MISFEITFYFTPVSFQHEASVEDNRGGYGILREMVSWRQIPLQLVERQSILTGQLESLGCHTALIIKWAV